MQEINITGACLIKWWLSISLDTIYGTAQCHGYMHTQTHVSTYALLSTSLLDIHNMHSMELNNIIIVIIHTHVCTCIHVCMYTWMLVWCHLRCIHYLLLACMPKSVIEWCTCHGPVEREYAGILNTVTFCAKGLLAMYMYMYICMLGSLKVSQPCMYATQEMLKITAIPLFIIYWRESLFLIRL